MKKTTCIFAALLAASLAVTGCSNLFEKFTNDDDTAKTGNDSVTAASSASAVHNTVIDSGLVVIKATEPLYNQITYKAGTTDYTVNALVSGDNTMQFRCFPDDSHATVTWSALKTKNAKLDGTYETLSSGETVAVSGGASDRYATSDIPYGVTVVTAKVTADDTQYSTTYTVTLEKPWNSSAEYITGDEDYTTYTVNQEVPAGVTIENVSYASKYGSVDENNYTILLSGGYTVITVVYKDDSGNEYTKKINITRPSDGDTSLACIGYSPSSSYDNGVSAISPSSPSSSDMGMKAADTATASNGTYKVTVSADNRVDVTGMKFVAVPTHKYTTLAYYQGDTCPAGDASSWSDSYTKAAEQALYTAGGYQKEVTPDNDNTTTTLWIKATSQPYAHSLSAVTKESDVRFHKIVITKAGKGNTKLTDLYADALYQGSAAGTTPLINCRTASAVGYEVPATAQNISVSTYCDSLTFYLRTLDKSDTDAPKTVTYAAENTKYVDNANTSFTKGTVSTKTIDGLDYYTFTIGTQDAGTDSDKDLPDGETTVTVYVNGTAAAETVFIKPDVNTTDLGSLGYSGADGKGNNTFYIYVANTVNTVTLTPSTKQQDAVLAASSERKSDANGATASGKVATACTQKATASTSWTVTVGSDTSDTEHLPEGTTLTTLTVTNNKKTSTYYVYIVKAGDAETRLRTISVDGTTISGYDWDMYYSTTASSAGGTASKVYTVNHSTTAAELSATALSSGAAIAVTKKVSDTVLASDATTWDSVTAVNVVSETGSFKKTLDALTSGCVMYIITVTSKDKTVTREYRVLMTPQLDSDATLKTLTAVQYGADTSYFNTIINGVSSGTDYAKNASLEYTGDIIVNASPNSSKATLAVTGITGDGTDISGSVTTGSDGKITIPYSVYFTKYAGKPIVITYTVTAEDTTSKIYTLTLNIPTLAAATTATGTVGGSTASYTYSTSYTHRMGYRFGSQRSDATKTKFYEKFGGVDVVGSSDSGSSWIVSSFKCSGWIFCVNVGGTDYWATIGAGGNSTALTDVNGNTISTVSLKVEPTLQYEGTDADAPAYLTLKETVTNNSGKEVKLGAIIDTLVDKYANNGSETSDAATITPMNYGIDMSNAGYKFSVLLENAVGVDNADYIWYGAYGSEDTYMWGGGDSEKKSSGTDSAVSFSWKLGTGTLYTRSFRMSLK